MTQSIILVCCASNGKLTRRSVRNPEPTPQHGMRLRNQPIRMIQVKARSYHKP